MDKQKAVIIARKVEAFAIGFIGVFFFSLGTSYFQERFLYQVPRILIPVFDLLGNVGLATGMLVLGGGLIYYGFTQWKPVAEKKALYWMIAAIGLIVGVALANINFNPNKAADIMEEMDKQREAQIDDIRNSGELNFSNAAVEKHFAEFKALYKRFEQSVENRDEAAITVCEDEFFEWSAKTGDVIQDLTLEEKTEFARYNAKLNIQWHDLRMKWMED